MNKPIDIVKIPSLPVKSVSYPQGKFTTGCADVMIGKGRDGSFMRLFYPTALDNIENIEINHWSSLFLGEKYSEGVAKIEFPFMPSLCVPFINALFDVLLPAVWEAEIADSQFPLVIYSHGLNAQRAVNSTLCNELASFGFVVAAVEHRDESACATFTLTSEHEEDWIFGKILGKDENEFKLRAKQIKIRAEECSRALDMLTRLNSGENLMNELENSDFDLQTLKGKLDLSKPIITGHSFGGATTILTLSQDQRFKLGVSLDPWMFPLKDQAQQLSETLQQPLLIIAVEQFQTEKNLECLKHFENDNVEIYSLREGAHWHQTDLSMLCSKYPVIMQKLVQCYDPSSSPECILTINHILIKKFILKNLNLNPDNVEAFDQFLAKYKDKFTTALIGGAKRMLGWDYTSKSSFELLFC